MDTLVVDFSDGRMKSIQHNFSHTVDIGRKFNMSYTKQYFGILQRIKEFALNTHLFNSRPLLAKKTTHEIQQNI